MGYKNPPTEYQFPKGTSGNPEGRPKGSLSAKTIYEEVGELTVPEEMRKQLAERGINVTDKSIDKAIAYITSIRAMRGDNGAVKEYNDRRFGKAPQSINLEGNLNSRVILQFEKIPRRKDEQDEKGKASE